MSKVRLAGPELLTNDLPPVLCFSHLRWNFVYQRPQHLMTRLQKKTNVFFFEEPLMVDEEVPRFSKEVQECGITVFTPMIPRSMDCRAMLNAQRILLDRLIEDSGVERFIAWYYTPMMLDFTEHLRPSVTIYDCMDELSGFDGAPSEMAEYERMLFNRADIVFAGGRSLFLAKRKQHYNVHLYSSSIDRAHFEKGRLPHSDPPDQQEIPHPRIGFFGVLDERLDRDLVRDVAKLKPEWQLVLLGPVVKIRQEDLPHADNIHYLGRKQYGELPIYLANWDAAMLPFARNASTRFISPTKTPEYLAAGKPVVSTSIHDVIEPYGELGLVAIADNAEDFVAAIEILLKEPRPEWLFEVDEFLKANSWDKTFDGMWREIQNELQERLRNTTTVGKCEEQINV